MCLSKEETSVERPVEVICVGAEGGDEWTCSHTSHRGFLSKAQIEGGRVEGVNLTLERTMCLGLDTLENRIGY